MSDPAARLMFYQVVGDEADMIGDAIESTHIPRVGEYVHVGGNRWRVHAVRYLFPQPCSITYSDGSRRPLVDLLVVPTLGAFWDIQP